MISRRASFALFLAACTKTEEPADPVWGKEPCAHCRMLVSDRRYAAEIVVDGERRWFDDIGCMIVWREAHAPASRAWVHAGDRWLDAAGARYVSGAATPMDFGFAVATDGALDYATVRAGALARDRGPR